MEIRKKVLIQMRDFRVGNGIAACIMNYYAYTTVHGYEIDFLLNRDIESPYKETAQQNGSKIYVLPHDTGKPNLENRKYIERILENKYDVLHVNISGLNAVMALKAAKASGAGRRIYHAHNPRETSSIKARIRSLVYETPSVWLADQYAACSTLAGDSVFGKRHYTVIKNAFDTSRFAFDENERYRLRSALNIENAFVVGVVSRFAEQKNPYFLIDIMAEIKKQISNAHLIWAGDGDLKESVMRYAEKKGIGDCVKLLGPRSDIEKLYSAMDVFLLPSKFEGLGIVYIEAQISGLPCFGSDRIPIDVEISENMYRIGLDKSAAEWAEEITAIGMEQKKRQSMVKTGFEIFGVEDSLCRLYSRDGEKC